MADEAGAQSDTPPDTPPLRGDWREVPHPSRLPVNHRLYDEILTRHGASVASRLPTYADPVSGYSVFTAEFLAARRYCCDSGCRHCPYVL